MFFCVVTLPFWHFCWCRGFCHRTGSDLLLFVSRTNLFCSIFNFLYLFCNTFKVFYILYLAKRSKMNSQVTILYARVTHLRTRVTKLHARVTKICHMTRIARMNCAHELNYNFNSQVIFTHKYLICVHVSANVYSSQCMHVFILLHRS